MKKTILISILVFYSTLSKAQYTTMTMPQALTGTTFNLNIHESTKQLVSGNQTITGSINNETFWGPTLFINKGDLVHMNVTNNLNESTTVHWHGMHLPAVMDGGPHQVIPAGTLWQPYWTVMNQASTLWYHPHLHETTHAQMTKGVGGFIIVKDPIESALALPRTYGVDDIVLALTSRSYNATTNTFVSPPASNRVYGDYMLSNGTPNAQYTLPKQYVRMRILNAEIERGYNLGFSDNRTFYIIANDGGLLNAPVAVTRVKLMVGERIEILVNLNNGTTDIVGSSIDLKAYNSGQTLGFPGGEPNTSGQFGSLLNNLDFTVLHINIGATTTVTTPITSYPSTLENNTYWTATTPVNVTRTMAVTGGQAAIPFTFDNTPFVLTTINKTVNLNDTEKWTVTNNNIFGHSFHLHDIEFKIVARNGVTTQVGTHESGWKDTFYLPRNESVTFIGKFDDFADADVNHPYMYHCHFAGHEDGGMMGQFIVTTALANNQNVQSTEFSLYPNPANDKLFVNLQDASTDIYYVTIATIEGRIVMMLPQPEWQNGIDILSLASGVYTFQMMDKQTKSVTTKKFIKK